MRVLSHQTNGAVGLVPYAVVEQAGAVIRGAMTALGTGVALCDRRCGQRRSSCGGQRSRCCARVDHPRLRRRDGTAGDFPDVLVCCWTGPIQACWRRWRARRRWPDRARTRRWDSLTSRAHLPVFDIDPLAIPNAAALAVGAIDWVSQRLGPTPIVIAASAPPEKVATVQRQLGRDAAGMLIEGAMARIATGLVLRDVRRLVVAGGETSGAVVSRLGICSRRIGGEIDPGVPWTYAEDGEASLLLALKSGNFDGRDFFLKALCVLN